MRVWVCLCEKRLEAVYKVHDPLPLSLFELVTLPIPDALCVLCTTKRKVRLVDLTAQAWLFDLGGYRDDLASQKFTRSIPSTE